MTRGHLAISHDAQNAIAIIRSLSRSAEHIISEVAMILHANDALSEKEIALFSQSMQMIRTETDELDHLFCELLETIPTTA